MIVIKIINAATDRSIDGGCFINGLITGLEAGVGAALFFTGGLAGSLGVIFSAVNISGFLSKFTPLPGDFSCLTNAGG